MKIEEEVCRLIEERLLGMIIMDIDDLYGWNFMESRKSSFHLDNEDLFRDLRNEKKKVLNLTKLNFLKLS